MVMLELIGLILKLVSKVFLLQRMGLPEYPQPHWQPGPTA